ncbi:MAG TPA: type II toxin-antitoxin system HicA family toxin [Alphaproteobacteria bacterium]|jgi:predicted RNA binding protein YcfA (HicA-like mRNA interferase family)|nr:type II toxin-antitoxin system HicA family toxin [Alphaproteobacteria bacterium]
MPKLAQLKPREVEKILLDNGFVVNVSKSSHKQYFNKNTGAHTTVPFHSKNIAIGTLRSVVRQSQLSIELFRK